MKHQADDLFKFFHGHFDHLSLFLYVVYEDGGFFTLEELQAATGFGRVKISEILRHLHGAGMIQLRLSRGSGARIRLNKEVALNAKRCLANSDMNQSFNFSISVPSSFSIKGENTPQTYDTLEKSISSLTEKKQKVSYASLASIEDGTLSRSGFLGDVSNSSSSQSHESHPKPEVIANPQEQTHGDNKKRSNKETPESLSAAADSLSKKPRRKKEKKEPKEKSLGARIWDSYVEEYQHVYGITPPSNASNYSITKLIGQRLGEKALEIIKFYVHHKDPFYSRNRHDIGLALKSTNRLAADWNLGEHLTKDDAIMIERRARNHQVLNKTQVKLKEEKANEVRKIDIGELDVF